MGLAEELLELNQYTPVVVRDGRTGGAAEMWVTDFIWRRKVIDDGEAQTIQERIGVPPGSRYPAQPLPVVPYTYLLRVPLAAA